MWVVSYDIPNNRRRAKVAKILEGFGRRAQYSVFECDINSEKCDRLEAQLKHVIDPIEDDVRFYPMNRADIKRVRLLGRAKLNRNQSYYIVDKKKSSDPPPSDNHPF